MPRNPDRIEKTLGIIRKIWSESPDLRLMQLLMNVVGETGAYYIEDDALVAALKAYYAGPAR